MDFVARLINEGYGEEDIGDILESLYLIEKNGGGSVLMEEQEYIVEVGGFLARQLAKLRSLPQNAAIRKQIKRLEKLIKGGKDKADDAGKIVKKADDVVDATKPPTASSPTRTRPSGTPVRQAGQTPSGKPAPKPKKPELPTATPIKPKGKTPPMGNLAKGALIGAGALTYSALNDGGAGTNGGNGTTQQTDNSNGQQPGTPGTTAPQPKGKFWWSTLKPKQLPYQRDSSYYRNIRAHYEFEGKIINEAHAIVLEYLIQNGHAETVSEANYIMNQMEFDQIADIVEEYPKKPIGYSNPSIDGNPIPNPAGHPQEGKPMSFNKAETKGYREAMQAHRKKYPNSYKK